MSELAAVTEASTRYLAKQEAADHDKEALFATWVTAVQACHTPEQIAAACTFTAAYVRRIVRERGAPPLPRGPKPRSQAT